MKRLWMLAFLALIPALAMAQASDWEVMGFGGDLHGTVDLQWQSKYMWRGFNTYGDKSAVQLTTDLDLFGSGFGVSVTGHRANSSGYEKNERWDICGYYKGHLFEEAVYQTDYRAGWVYYSYPQRPNEQMDLQEIHTVLAWPKVTGIEGLVPSYALVKLWPAYSGSLVGSNASGFAHIFMLDYNFTVPGFLPEVPEQTIRLHSELVYNDGVHPAGGNADHDWSNAVIGASTDFELGYGFSLTPAVYYQASMDKSVDNQDETWVTIGLSYSF